MVFTGFQFLLNFTGFINFRFGFHNYSEIIMILYFNPLRIVFSVKLLELTRRSTYTFTCMIITWA